MLISVSTQRAQLLRVQARTGHRRVHVPSLITALFECGQLSMCSPLSYCLRFSGSLSTSYAFRSFLNRPSASALCSSLFCNSIVWLMTVALVWLLGKHKFCCTRGQPLKPTTHILRTNRSAIISRRQLSIHQETDNRNPALLPALSRQPMWHNCWTQTHCHIFKQNAEHMLLHLVQH